MVELGSGEAVVLAGALHLDEARRLQHDDVGVHVGVAGGRILEAARGQEGFGYDPLFYSEELGRTFGEATAEEKDAVSHRGRALRALVEALRPPAP